MPQNLITEMKHTNFLKDTTTKTHTRRKKPNKLTPMKEIESMINDFPKQRRMGLNGFIGKFIQKFISRKKKKKDTKSLQSVPENRNRGHTFSFIGEVVP